MGYSLATLAVVSTWEERLLVGVFLVALICACLRTIYTILDGAFQRAVAAEDKAKLPPPGPSPTQMSPPPPKIWTPGVGVTCPKCGHCF